jgi:hypothetical protein
VTAVRNFFEEVKKTHVRRKRLDLALGRLRVLLLLRVIDGFPTNMILMESLCEVVEKGFGFSVLILY